MLPKNFLLFKEIFKRIVINKELNFVDIFEINQTFGIDLRSTLNVSDTTYFDLFVLSNEIAIKNIS